MTTCELASLDKTGSSATTYTATPDNADALNLTASGVFDADPDSEDITVALTGHADGAGTSGSKNFSVTVDNLENDGDPDDVIDVSVQVYQPLSLVTDTIADGLEDDLYLENESSGDGGQRAAALMVSEELTGDTTHWSVTGFVSGTIAEGENPLVATASFNDLGLLGNDSLAYEATYKITSEYDDGDIDLGGAQASFDRTWDLSRTVTVDEVTGGSVDLGDGEDLAGYGATSTGGTVAQLLDGVAGTGGRTVSMSFTPSTDPYMIGDVVNLTGLDAGDLYVLQVSYDEAELLAHLAARYLPADETLVSLMMMTPDGSQVAVALNDYAGSGITDSFHVVGPYVPGVTPFELGYHGVDPDNDVVWAILNHNSEFGAGVSPEPTCLMLAGVALLGLRKRRS